MVVVLLLLLLLIWSLLLVYYYRPEKNFSEGIVFSRVCDFVLFFFIYFIYLFICSVYTITLERLNQSEPNFHTRLLTEIARPCTKMGIAGHM